MRQHLLTLFSTGALMLLSGRADATIAQAIGGPGGQPFTIECPVGQAVAGFQASAGAWLDGVGVLCRPVSGGPQPVGWAGGQGGGPQQAYCRSGKYMTGFNMTFTRGNGLQRQYVNTVGLFCDAGAQYPETCILSGDMIGDDYDMQTCSFRIGGPNTITDATNLSCPVGEVLTGIHGRHGSFIHALGAICGARSEVEVARPPISATNSSSVTMTNPAARLSVPPQDTAQLPPATINSSDTRLVASGARVPGGSCKSGYVWREGSPEDRVCVTPESRERVRTENTLADSRRDAGGAYGPNSCKAGFVWREAFPADLACVTPDARSAAAQENAAHHQFRH